jgi:hypothetical protein
LDTVSCGWHGKITKFSNQKKLSCIKNFAAHLLRRPLLHRIDRKTVFVHIRTARRGLGLNALDSVFALEFGVLDIGSDFGGFAVIIF